VRVSSTRSRPCGRRGSRGACTAAPAVRNNPRAGAGALGFLRDRRRINVGLSRAKWQLILVGSLDFLREAVLGVNPDDEPHDLSFLTRIGETIDTLSGETEKRGDRNVRLATILPASELGGQK
jgi:hypothetical protein